MFVTVVVAHLDAHGIQQMLEAPFLLAVELPVAEDLTGELPVLSRVDVQRHAGLLPSQIVVQNIFFEHFALMRFINNRIIFFDFFFYRGCGGKVFFFAFFCRNPIFGCAR